MHGVYMWPSDVRKVYALPSLTIHAESFVVEPSATRNISSTLDEALVRFRGSNKEGTWKKEDKFLILELAEGHGLVPQYGCRFGTCGSCEMKRLGGRVVMFGKKE
jgi:ferredoxin